MMKLFHFYVLEFVNKLLKNCSEILSEILSVVVFEFSVSLAEMFWIQSKNIFDFFWLRVFTIFLSITFAFMEL